MSLKVEVLKEYDPMAMVLVDHGSEQTRIMR